MAHVTTCKINLFPEDKHDMKNIYSYSIGVTVDGIFTTTLPEDMVKIFEAANIDLDTNRNKKKGFFSDKTIDGLQKQIGDVVKEFNSRTLVSETIVIGYVIQTTCSYCINDKDEFVPNGQWIEDGMFNKDYKRYGWKHGTVSNHDSAHPKPTGILLWCKPQVKKEYVYKSGKKKTEFEDVPSDIQETDINLKWLCGLCAQSIPSESRPKEIEYSPNVAAFFVSMFKSIYAINEKVKQMVEPEAIQLLADSGARFLQSGQ